MKSHLMPLFIQAEINYVRINKVLVDGGAAVNLLPQFLLKKIGLSESDLNHTMSYFPTMKESLEALLEMLKSTWWWGL